MAKVNGFPENTTKVFSGVITYNGSNPDTTNDTITFIMKINKEDADAVAVIDADATGLGVGGTFTISLTPTLTDIAPRVYRYEIVWHLSAGGVFVLDAGSITVTDKTQDNV